MQALAKAADGSVTVLNYPILQGIASGSGISGSSAWHGAFRFRQFLTGVKQRPASRRTAIFANWSLKRTNTALATTTSCCAISMVLFPPEIGISDLDKAARQARVDEIFLSGLSQIIRQGRDAMSGETSREFGATLIAEMPEAKKERIRKKELVDAMKPALRRQTFSTSAKPAGRRRRRRNACSW